MSNHWMQSYRYWTLFACLVLGFALILGRLYQLHILQHSDLSGVAEASRERIERLPGIRGSILDRRGNPLASTQTVYTVGFDPLVFNETDPDRLQALAQLLGMGPWELQEALALGAETERRWRKLAEGIGEETYRLIVDLGIKGVYGNRILQRDYPGGSLAAHVIGYINKEGIAVDGVERYMDFYLSGQDGWRETEADGRRRERAEFRHRQIEPGMGLNVVLTLDLVVQEIVEMELQKLVDDYLPQSATIIVSRPQTGDILALANYPSFDPARFWEADMAALRNRAVTDLYEPGSCFKIVPVSAALERGIIRPEDRLDTGLERVLFEGRAIRLPNDHKELGIVPLHKIVSQSSNRGTAQVAMLLGEEALYGWARAFGFGQPTGYDISLETPGILHEVKDWDGLTISRLPIGYAVGATPLQIHMAMSVVANQGIYMEPRIVQQVSDPQGYTLAEFSNEPRQRVLSERTARTMSAMLTAVANEGGTAPDAYMEGYLVAGKTGTTRKIMDGQYSPRHHVASFSGFFPADDPEFVITVVVDEAQISGSAYGGRVAAPCFRNIARQLVSYFALPPRKPQSPSYAFPTTVSFLSAGNPPNLTVSQ